jgi:ornithine carbamoyltransferase
MVEEGGYASYIDIATSQFGYKESVEDSAKVLAGFYDAIEYRGYAQAIVSELALHAQIPVYNGLTDEDHPTQLLADLLTIAEHLPEKNFSQLKVAYIGDTRNNMCNAWMFAAAKLGFQLVGYGPKSLWPNEATLALAASHAKESGALIEFSDNPAILANADVIYTDVWVSMGEEAELVKRIELLHNFQVNRALLLQTKNPKVLFMHCLPAYHDFKTTLVQNTYEQTGLDMREVSDEVFRGPHSVVFQQAANRLPSIKALLVATLNPTAQQILRSSHE